MLCSINGLAELTAIDRRTIAKRMAKTPPIIVEGVIKKWPSNVALRAIYQPDIEDYLDPAQERAALDRERRKQLELVNAKAERRLLDAAIVAETWAAQVAIARGRLLSLPARIAPAVIGLGDLRGIELAIRDAIFEALLELSADEQGPAE